MTLAIVIQMKLTYAHTHARTHAHTHTDILHFICILFWVVLFFILERKGYLLMGVGCGIF